MKNAIATLIFACLFSMSAFTQDKPVKFTVEVSTDSILMGNYFEVKFILENANGKNFEAPAFEKFNVVSGPNFSTSFSMVNGEVTQSMTITYYLEPHDIGAYYILPASVEAEGKVLETTPLEVLVVPNPDGIQQNPLRQDEQTDRFSPFDFNREFSFPAPPPPAQKLQPKPEETPKKKRKTIRI